jgi:hypothetical protein
MHARELVELAALVAIHADRVVRGPGQLPPGSVEAYWTGSKCRFDRWGRSLKELACRAGEHGAGVQETALAGVVEEVLSGEMLTRVWTAAMCAYDRHRGTESVEPVARSVLAGHMEARHRVLTLLVSGGALSTVESLRLNRLRHQTERFCDALLGCLAGCGDVGEFAVDVSRARDFADDLAQQRRGPGAEAVWPMVLASLQAAFRQALNTPSPNPDLNAKIAASIVACLPAELFASAGMLDSLWLARIAKLTADAQVLIDELLAGSPAP